jgi:hypothetical protein
MQSEPGLLAQAASCTSRPARLIRDALAARRAPTLIIVLGLLLTSSSLTIGFSYDEYFQRVALQERPELAGLQRAPWELFTFTAGPEMNRALMEDGVLPWWTDQELVISFLRPLTSLTLWLDHSAWPDSAPLMHVHSMAWFALLLACLWLVFRELADSRAAAALALLLYAIDDARAFPVGWIAQRNALVAFAPASLALIAHHRFRSGRGAHYGLLAPACLALGLAGGEMAVTICGYLFAYALFLDRGTLAQRARSLLPYAALLLAYRAFYNALGYGALHSGVYLDPGREPLAFLSSMLTRLPVLVFSQFALLPADLWEAYPMIATWLRPLVFSCILLGLWLLWRLLWPLLCASAKARFWALGSALSTIPVCGVYPEDRLLTATSLGGAALLSMLLLSFCEGTYPNSRRWTRAACVALIAMHCVLAPAFLTVRSQDIKLLGVMLDRADASISRKPEIAHKTLILLNPPLSPLGIFFPLYRQAQGIRLPHSYRFLATGESDLLVERLDERSVRLRPERGFLFSSTQRVFRHPDRPFRRGDVVALSDMRVEVTELTPDARPAEIVVRLGRPLDDPSLLWVRWEKNEYVPFELPPPRTSALLPRIDPFAVMFDTQRAQR